MAAYRSDIIARIRRSALAPDYAEVERQQPREGEVMFMGDCAGFRWSGEEHVRSGRESLQRAIEQARAIDAQFQRLSGRLSACPA